MTPLHAGVLIATSVALRPRLAARSPMGGASSPATHADACGCETLIQSPRAVRRRRIPQSWCSTDSAFRTGALIATFRCAVPARSLMRGASLPAANGEWSSTSVHVPGRLFAAGRCVVERWRAGRAGCQPSQACRRASVGRVAANGSMFSPLDAVQRGASANW
jgi:hypothetical protein